MDTSINVTSGIEDFTWVSFQMMGENNKSKIIAQVDSISEFML